MPRGTLVIIALASMVMVAVAFAGTGASAKAGAVKVFGCQSSRKNPMVGATAGSTGGFITNVSPAGGGETGGGSLCVDFLHARKIAMPIMNEKKLNMHAPFMHRPTIRSY